jgi:hypothetical protein
MTPKLSSYWLYFITSTSYHLAKALVGSMKVEVVCKPESLAQIKSITQVSRFPMKPHSKGRWQKFSPMK